MSVVKGKRSESNLQFICTARDIALAAVSLRIDKPKRYSFLLDKLVDTSIEVLTKVKSGNSIYPTTAQEVALRQLYFKDAIAACQAVSSLVEVIVFKLRENGTPVAQVQKFSEDLELEIKLLKGVMASDRARFKSLRDKKQ